MADMGSRHYVFEADEAVDKIVPAFQRTATTEQLARAR